MLDLINIAVLQELRCSIPILHSNEPTSFSHEIEIHFEYMGLHLNFLRGFNLMSLLWMRQLRLLEKNENLLGLLRSE